MSAAIMAVVGCHYLVPCLVGDPRVAWMANDRNLVPVIGPMHSDKDFIGADFEHFHIDWRFVEDVMAPYLRGFEYSPHGHVIRGQQLLEGPYLKPLYRSMKCVRLMPDFPAFKNEYGWAALERAQRRTCNKLKPGNICPHRGIDLTPFEQPDGTAICPGHGLRWNLRTGEMIPRHAT